MNRLGSFLRKDLETLDNSQSPDITTKVKSFHVLASVTIKSIKQKVRGIIKTEENILVLQQEYMEKLKRVASENEIKADNPIVDEVAELQNKIFYLLVDGNPEKIVEITLKNIHQVVEIN